MRKLTLAFAFSAVSQSFAATPAPQATPTVQAATAKPLYNRLSRLDFNQRAVEKNVPLFWRNDANKDNVLDPDELVVVWGPNAVKRDTLVASSGFTPDFTTTYEGLLKPADLSKAPADDKKRREKVLLELAQGRPTLVENDFANASEEDKAVVRQMEKVALLIEKLHGRQLGTLAMGEKIPADDAASRALFFRNQGPTCEAPKTENDPDCNAIADKPKPRSGLYPADIQADKNFCDMLSKQKNSKELMGHFSAVVAGDKPGTFKAVPYNVFYKDDMEALAKELEVAAAAVKSKEEAPFKAYLTAAAKAFRTNNWEPANEAWAKMGVNNSKWYLRVAPDEVYYEPCAWKAGFAMAFALINKDSLAWQKKLEPVKSEMENALATLAGAPYKARKVAFKLPDFIDIILNAGDARPAHGATIGQSLPNWGKVAEKGGRTVAMTNLYTDADSQNALRDQMASLYCPATQALASTDPKPATMSTVLHEAAHNLGPSHEYKVKGKEDDQIFGGPLASTMEELKAQTSALYFADWLVEKKVISQEEANQAHIRDVAWAFGHISRGMYDASGKPKNYSQLASIQLGTLHKAGVLVWSKDAMAANGKDKGCFELKLDAWKPALDTLATAVLKIKGSGDKAGADKLVADFVDANDGWKQLREVITERWTRAPKASFVYAVRY
ncbi:MAG: hypothetical protein K1X64_13075 [Myxococcaceae bacterium]|nr:hypothetical protein [Myxococcaceae bacterium]